MLSVEPVELSEHRRSGQALVGEEHHPVVPSPGLVPLAQNAHVVAAPGSQRDAARHAGGHVGAQRTADRLKLLGAQAQLPQLVAGHQGGGRVGGPTGHAAGDGDALVDADAQSRGCRRPGARSGEALEDACGAHRQVGLRGQVRHRAGRRLVDATIGQVGDRLDAHARRLGGAHGHGLAQVQGLEDRDQRVVAVRRGRTHAQGEVHFAGRTGTHFTHAVPSS